MYVGAEIQSDAELNEMFKVRDPKNLYFDA